MKKLFIFAVFLFYITQALFSKSDIFIEQILSQDYPKMEVYVSVKEGHEPVTTMRPGNFSANIDGKEVKKIDTQGFQYTEEGVAYAVLISANGATEGPVMAEQQRALVNLIEKMKPQDTISVYYFGNEYKVLFENMPKSEDLAKELSKIEILGSNPVLYDALNFAASRLGTAKLKRKVLIVMSDGRDMGSKYTKKMFLEKVDTLNIPVYGVGIFMLGGRNLSNIHELAEHTGGGYMHAMYPGLLSERIVQLNKQITHGYVLKFKASGVPGDDGTHQLTLTVRSEDEESSFTKNFIAKKRPVPLWVKIVGIVMSALIAIAIIVFFYLLRRGFRKKLGINKRKCPVCKRRMKDDWDECVFCKYLPPKKKKKKKKDKNFED